LAVANTLAYSNMELISYVQASGQTQTSGMKPGPNLKLWVWHRNQKPP